MEKEQSKSSTFDFTNDKTVVEKAALKPKIEGRGDLNYAVVDIETTGGSPRSSKITEIAIYKHDGKKSLMNLFPWSILNQKFPISLRI